MLDHFKNLSKLLDDKNDKYERIYKTNRDITVKSKRLIFSLQRLPGLLEDEKNNIMKRAANDLRDIERTLIKYIAMELKDSDDYQFLYAYTGGIQEYIEALSFHHYLLTNTLITHSEVQEKLIFVKKDENYQDVQPLKVLVPQKEYILGLADLTGELMRFCIKSMSIGDFDVCYTITDSLKQMKAGFLSLGYVNNKELNNKINVFNNSLLKVEDACYSLKLRKCELPADCLIAMVSASLSDTDHLPLEMCT